MWEIIKSFLQQNFLIVLVSIILALYYGQFSEKFRENIGLDETPIEYSEKLIPDNLDGKEKLFTKEELAKFNGEELEDQIYLSILGRVYDVSKGKKFYGKDCSYHFFAGRDASVGSVTGEFESYTTESDDVLSLSQSDVLSIFNWIKLYDKQYIYKGKLIGRFFSKDGSKTDYHRQVDEVVEAELLAKEQEKKRDEEFPPCNIQWSVEAGSEVWCSNSSGGKERSWVGVPRKFFKPGSTSFHCVCVQEDKLSSPHLREYDNCGPTSTSCRYTV